MTQSRLRRVLLIAAPVAALFLTAAQAADPDPKIMGYTLPDKIKWNDNGNGAKSAILMGDPAKPGMYVVLQIWTPGHMSRPHFHPNDRYITVLKGTWWVGWGPKWDPATTVPMKAGTVVTHYAKGIHWDGAKDEEAMLQIVGMGPATSTQAEQK